MAFSESWSYSKLALLGFLYSIALLACSFSVKANIQKELNVKRSDFAKDFVFGVSTSAVQTEGSSKSGGKGPNVWDAFLDKNPGAIIDGSNMETAIDSYRRFKEDVKHVKDLGVDSYRFSISWTRILPNGSLSGGVNKEGIDHYNSLIDELIKYGIKPFVTMLHFDFPQILEEKYGGPLSPRFVDDFKDYAEILFRTFGDRVKTWVTINEPMITVKYGYDLGFPPSGRCSDRKTCKAGNSSTEPYTVAHNFLLAHATAASLYKRKFQPKQGGQIGVSVSAQYYEPYSKSRQDRAAAKRGLDFEIGWFLKPLVSGHYPKIMRMIAKDRLPKFTAKEKKLVKGSIDFMGLNYYTAIYAKSIPVDFHASPVSSTADVFVNLTAERNGVLIGPPIRGSETTYYLYPKGVQKILQYMKREFKNPAIYITENGLSQTRNDSLPFEVQLNDPSRIDYIVQHLHRIRKAIKNGVNVKGYFYWSLLDGFEWIAGYINRFGLYYIDYNNNLTRTPKDSAKWFKRFLKHHE
ncbi:hypothetical protein QYF36_026730 [Acer negundo]|nr:hypothetical protein QYF36_026730 [Acer negundo]